VLDAQAFDFLRFADILAQCPQTAGLLDALRQQRIAEHALVERSGEKGGQRFA